MRLCWEAGIRSIGNYVSLLSIGARTVTHFILGDEKTVNRRVYLDSPLSVQVVTPKQHDYELFQAMEIVDRAVQGRAASASAKL